MTTPTERETSTLGDDLLVGAEEIAKFLSGPRRRISVRVVYRLRHTGWPIVRTPGLGIVARKSTLLAFVERLERGVAERASDASSTAAVGKKGRRMPSVGR
ncbi:MAG: hypothetical protein ACHQF3_00170 [Alphaproteobacteria bacterium]